jgi:Family of unknown function (DUF6286)
VSAPRAPHTGRGATSVIVAILVAAAATIVAIDVISALTNHGTQVSNQQTIATHLRDTVWSATSVTVIAIVAIVVGAFLVLAAILPARPKLLALQEDDPQLVVGTSRRSLRRALTAQATRIDGVSAARVRIRRHTVRIKADTPLRDPGDLADRIRQAVVRRLDELHPARPLAVRVDLRHKEG